MARTWESYVSGRKNRLCQTWECLCQSFPFRSAFFGNLWISGRRNNDDVRNSRNLQEICQVGCTLWRLRTQKNHAAPPGCPPTLPGAPRLPEPESIPESIPERTPESTQKSFEKDRPREHPRDSRPSRKFHILWRTEGTTDPISIHCTSPRITPRTDWASSSG